MPVIGPLRPRLKLAITFGKLSFKLVWCNGEDDEMAVDSIE
jgi:hypothetical protein